jgi:hypothetical protein
MTRASSIGRLVSPPISAANAAIVSTMPCRSACRASRALLMAPPVEANAPARARLTISRRVETEIIDARHTAAMSASIVPSADQYA